MSWIRAAILTTTASMLMAQRSTVELEPLIRKTCSQCHVFPPPETLPKKAWLGMLNLMFDLASPRQLDRPLNDVRFDELLSYYTARAPGDLNAKPWSGSQAAELGMERVATLGQGPHPGASHVRLMRLWEDVAGPQLLVTDMMSGWVAWADPRNWEGGLHRIIRLANPAHVEAVDLDRDGRMDLIVGDLGTPVATDQKAGAVVWLRRTGSRSFEKVPLAERLGRVADVQVADFNSDGKPDLVVADFGRYTAGQVLYLENRSAGGKVLFTQTAVMKAPGAVNVPVLDLNGDGKPDFAAVIAQGQESVVGFLNNGSGQFERRVLWAAPHPAWGFSGMVAADVNRDGNMDIIVTHGDTVDDGVHFKPYQGVSWLENKGGVKFEFHGIGSYYGAYAPKAVDLDGDGDLDILASAFLPGSDLVNQRRMNVPGIVWYEQVSPGAFQAHAFPDDMAVHPALEVGDVDGDGSLAVISGTLWIRPSAFGTQAGSVDIWRVRRSDAAGAKPR